MKVITSKLNNTPPIGDPNATDMPAAAAAESTSRFLAELILVAVMTAEALVWYLRSDLNYLEASL